MIKRSYLVGDRVGNRVGAIVGDFDGFLVGDFVGDLVGNSTGDDVGDVVGEGVGCVGLLKKQKTQKKNPCHFIRKDSLSHNSNIPTISSYNVGDGEG